MFIDCSNMLNDMCGALPVSAEDALGLQAAADRLKGRETAAAGVVDTPIRRMEFCRYIDEEVNPARAARGQSLISESDAVLAFGMIDKFIADWRGLNA